LVWLEAAVGRQGAAINNATKESDMDEATLQVFAMSAFVIALIGIVNWI
jgi:hypothetical protein